MLAWKESALPLLSDWTVQLLLLNVASPCACQLTLPSGTAMSLVLVPGFHIRYIVAAKETVCLEYALETRPILGESVTGGVRFMVYGNLVSRPVVVPQVSVVVPKTAVPLKVPMTCAHS